MVLYPGILIFLFVLVQVSCRHIPWMSCVCVRCLSSSLFFSQWLYVCLDNIEEIHFSCSNLVYSNYSKFGGVNSSAAFKYLEFSVSLWYTEERRLSGGGLAGGRLNRAHECDNCLNVQRTFAAIVKWATRFLCSSEVSKGIFEIHFCSWTVVKPVVID